MMRWVRHGQLVPSHVIHNHSSGPGLHCVASSACRPDYSVFAEINLLLESSKVPRSFMVTMDHLISGVGESDKVQYAMNPNTQSEKAIKSRRLRSELI